MTDIESRYDEEHKQQFVCNSIFKHSASLLFFVFQVFDSEMVQCNQKKITIK